MIVIMRWEATLAMHRVLVQCIFWMYVIISSTLYEGNLIHKVYARLFSVQFTFQYFFNIGCSLCNFLLDWKGPGVGFVQIILSQNGAYKDYSSGRYSGWTHSVPWHHGGHEDQSTWIEQKLLWKKCIYLNFILKRTHNFCSYVVLLISAAVKVTLFSVHIFRRGTVRLLEISNVLTPVSTLSRPHTC